MVMKKQDENSVHLADFKARLSQYIRTVRRGVSLTLLDRQTPVAKVVPLAEGGGRMTVRPATLNPVDLELPPPLKARVDIVRYVAEERQGYR